MEDIPPPSDWIGWPEEVSTPPLEPLSPLLSRGDPLSSQGGQSQDGVEVDEVLEVDPEEGLEEVELEEDDIEEVRTLASDGLSGPEDDGTAEDEEETLMTLSLLP